jgi:hypothetical protein
LYETLVYLIHLTFYGAATAMSSRPHRQLELEARVLAARHVALPARLHGGGARARQAALRHLDVELHHGAAAG